MERDSTIKIQSNGMVRISSDEVALLNRTLESFIILTVVGCIGVGLFRRSNKF